MATIKFFSAASNEEVGSSSFKGGIGPIVSNLARNGIKRRKGNFGEGWVREGESDELHVWMYERSDDSSTDVQSTTEEPQ